MLAAWIMMNHSWIVIMQLFSEWVEGVARQIDMCGVFYARYDESLKVGLSVSMSVCLSVCLSVCSLCVCVCECVCLFMSCPSHASNVKMQSIANRHQQLMPQANGPPAACLANLTQLWHRAGAAAAATRDPVVQVFRLKCGPKGFAANDARQLNNYKCRIHSACIHSQAARQAIYS